MELAPVEPAGWAKRVRKAVDSLPSLLSREPAWQRLAHEDDEGGEDAQPSGETTHPVPRYELGFREKLCIAQKVREDVP